MKERMRGSGIGQKLLRALCACALAAAIGLCAIAQETEAPELLEPVGVVTDTAQAYIGDISDIKLYEAAVVPFVDSAAFSVSGTVEQVHVIVGQTVKAGDVLISLDQKNLSLQMENISRRIAEIEINSNYEEQLSRIDRRILELELEMLMVQTPGDDETIALKKMDIEKFDADAELARELRKLELTRLRETLAGIEEQMVQNVLTAPFDGNVMYISDIGRGSYVNAFAPLVYIADDSRMRVETEYIMDSILNVANRIYAHIGGGIYELEPIPVDQKDLFARTLSGETITTEFEICDAGKEISVGDYAAVCVQSKLEEDVLLIPRNALYIESGSMYVYIMENGGRIYQNVTVGHIAQHLVEIKEGLQEGDVVYVQE